jgi:FAD dependent oxidoreductase
MMRLCYRMLTQSGVASDLRFCTVRATAQRSDLHKDASALLWPCAARPRGEQAEDHRKVITMGSKIAIVGAGITGPSAALTLARAGHDVTVYEQRPADMLYSAGILGLTPGNWSALQFRSVDLPRYELPNGFRDYGTGIREQSPFRYITWTGLHQSLVDAAVRAGARFVWTRHVNARRLRADYVMDAGGIFTASRYLASQYTGFEIYRGLSPVNIPDDFVTVRPPAGSRAGYFTVGRTPDGAAWAFFVKRPKPAHLSTVDTTTHPHEWRYLPAEYARVVKATPAMIVSPMSDWAVPDHAHDPTFTRFALGDATGPVRPVTTSGANLAVMAGMHADVLVSGSHEQVTDLETSLLRRRALDMAMGAELDGPEIGGNAEDVMYYQHHSMLFGPGER